MAKAGAGNATALLPDEVSLPMATTTIALRFASDVSAHRGAPNAKGYHHNRKRGGNYCHRSGGASSRSNGESTSRLAPRGMTPLCVLRNLGVFANCAERVQRVLCR